MKQTYASYYKDYIRTPNGRKSVRKAQSKYRQRLAKRYGVSQRKAMEMHREKTDEKE